ncbi:MAG: hypothetical protein HC941_15155 [Microcoleus sp. SU_5_3]|nr:hypothetical protein [Microcoleus sp. SU_5_3]
MRFEGLNVAEFFSNIKDKLSKVTSAASGNSGEKSPNASNGTRPNLPESEAKLSALTDAERSEYVVEDPSHPPLSESELEWENQNYQVVKRDWEGLKRLIAWLEIEPQVTSLQTKGKELLQPGLTFWELNLSKSRKYRTTTKYRTTDKYRTTSKYRTTNKYPSTSKYRTTNKYPSTEKY